MKPKLEIELVPSSAWYSNLRSILEPADWDIVRKLVYKKANYCCEICGGKGEKHPVEAHEVWGYQCVPVEDGAPHYFQVLEYVQALCPICHEAKHIGLAQIRGFGDRAKQTLMRVNYWGAEQTEIYVRNMFLQWSERSRNQWTINIDKVVEYGIDRNKYIDKINK